VAGDTASLEVTAHIEASEIDTVHPFVKFLGTVQKSTRGTQSPTGSMLGTDARFMRNRLGIPTVVYGPGSPQQAHTADEWIEIAELVAAAKTFSEIYLQFARYARPSTDPE